MTAMGSDPWIICTPGICLTTRCGSHIPSSGLENNENTFTSLGKNANNHSSLENNGNANSSLETNGNTVTSLEKKGTLTQV